ncbi:MAG TPA: hypothetical protein VHK69_12875, partial [Chitinophagaceae bacterium]|nr:hypothetical protein [Chitinophagaceae bacterium]
DESWGTRKKHFIPMCLHLDDDSIFAIQLQPLIGKVHPWTTAYLSPFHTIYMLPHFRTGELMKKKSSRY